MTLAHYELDGTTAIIRLDDGKANALSHAFIEEVLLALSRAEQEASAVVLVGRPERFCAGFDLKVMTSSPEATINLLRAGRELYVRLYGCKLPVIIACTGHAMAGGAILLLTGDVRIGTAGPYRIGFNEVAIGMPLPLLGMELARDRLSHAEIVRATLGATIYDPEQAVRAGFLDEVASPDAVVSRAKEVAAKMGTFARPAFHGTKSRLRASTIERMLSTFDEDMKSITFGG